MVGTNLSPRAEKRFNFDYYLNQAVKTDSDIKARSFSAPRYKGLDEEIGSHFFNANFYSGGGWKLWQNQHKKYNLMIDNLWVRGTMTIWEMVINQLRASNGTVIISSCGKTKEDGAVSAGGTTYNLWFDSGDNTSVDMQPFAVNDIIMARRFDMPHDGDAPATLLEVYGTVTAISVGGEYNKITVDCAGSPSTPLNKGVLEFVRIGNTSDASRQGSIVLTSDGIDSDLGGGGTGTVPYIDVYAGVDTRAKFMDKDYVQVRLGRLDEITGGTDEFGLWGKVVHLVGSGGSGWATTLEGSGEPETNGYPAANYTDGTTYYDYTNGVYYLIVSGSWTTMSTMPNENGKIVNVASPSGAGFFADATHFGLYKDSAWRIYFDSDGDVHFGDAGGDAFQYAYATNTVTLKSSISGQRLEIDGSSNTMSWYNSSGKVVEISSTVGDTNSYSGVDILRDGILYINKTENSPYCAYLEHNLSSWTTTGWGMQILVRGATGATGRNAFGIQSVVSTTNPAGTNIGGQFSASGGTTNWAGIFTSGNVNMYNTLYFGSGLDTNLYRNAPNVLKTDDAFVATLSLKTSGQVKMDAGTTSADGLLWGNDTNLFRSGTNILKTNDNFVIDETLKVGNNTVNGLLYLGNTGVKAIQWHNTNSRFQFNDDLWIGGDLLLTGTVDGAGLTISEIASAPAHAAGIGKLWVKNDTHAPLRYTTDTGLDDWVCTAEVKTTTGHPSAWNGRIEINEFDNKAYIYADGAWREIATW